MQIQHLPSDSTAPLQQEPGPTSQVAAQHSMKTQSTTQQMSEQMQAAIPALQVGGLQQAGRESRLQQLDLWKGLTCCLLLAEACQL